jgi:hypothetical protein
MGKERITLRKQLEQTKRAIQRDGYNRGVRAALKVVEGWRQPHIRSGAPVLAETADSIRLQLKRLIKPPLENPNLSIKP